ncbi:MAG: HD domain-containing protein [Pseudomonadota bacterium]
MKEELALARLAHVTTRIRDPIHGSILLDARERQVIDAPFFQRLRWIRQMGFADAAFPGATHTRYVHALGACHVSGLLFDAIQRRLPRLKESERSRLRAALRLAVLLHDLGHPPFSHSSESILPPRRELALPAWLARGDEGRATHEDYTLKIILDSELTELLARVYAEIAVPPEAIASLLSGVPAPGGPYFVVGNVDYAPLLRQIVSSEVDADRMDYLLRDSFFTGAKYGTYDLAWLVENVGAHEHDGKVELALGSRAIIAFEDFLLSRYHMFLTVYYHRTPICFDRMLREYFRETGGEFTIPADTKSYLGCDDVQLLAALRASDNRWAQRIARRQPFRLLVETGPYEQDDWDLSPIEEALTKAGIEFFSTKSEGTVSKYFGTEAEETIWVHVKNQGRFVPLDEYTPLYRRYQKRVRIRRIYVDPERIEDARRVSGLPRPE